MARTPLSDIALPIKLERKRGSPPVSDQIASHIREATLRGTLRSGDRLPSIRMLSEHLGVARATIEVAYAQLLAEGYLETKVGASTRIAKSIPDKAFTTPRRHSQKKSVEPPTLSERAMLFANVPKTLPIQTPSPLAVISPSAELSPRSVWSRIFSRIARTPWRHAGYAEPQGYLPLREAIADHVRKMRGVRCTPDQIIVTAGTQQGLMLCANVLFDYGDMVWLENPCYPPLAAILRTSHLGFEPIPVDGKGLLVEEGFRRCSVAKGAFVTPSHQYPLGMAMSMDRRLSLLQWAKENRSWIIEDDYDSELRYVGRPLPALQGLDTDGSSVIYLGTFSKMLFPGLRLGYVIVPHTLVEAFSGARLLMDRHSPGILQAVLAEFMEEGHYEIHIRRIRILLTKKREALLNECHKQLQKFGRILPSDQGMHVTFVFHRHTDDVAVATELHKHGIEVRALSPFYINQPSMNGLMMGFAGFSIEATQAAISVIRNVLESRKISTKSTFNAT